MRGDLGENQPKKSRIADFPPPPSNRYIELPRDYDKILQKSPGQIQHKSTKFTRLVGIYISFGTFLRKVERNFRNEILQKASLSVTLHAFNSFSSS